MHRYARWSAALALVLASLLLVRCGAPTPRSTSPALPLRNELLHSVTLVGQPVLFDTPWDAMPSPDGAIIYFTANGPTGAGVFSVPFGGGQTRALAVGAPFIAPRGLAVSTDGRQIYVADTDAVGADGRPGSVFVLPVAGGAPMPLADTAGTTPHGLDVVRAGSGDALYIAGVDPATKQPAIMRRGGAGADAVRVIASGAPLKEPSGIAVAKDGTIYVADRLASGQNLGSVFRIVGSTIETIAQGVRLGTPVAGAALTLDESALLVSALATDRDSAQVLVITLPGLEQGLITKVIEANRGAGGVHRAYQRNVFAWADSTVGANRQRSGSTAGGVYALQP